MLLCKVEIKTFDVLSKKYIMMKIMRWRTY